MPATGTISGQAQPFSGNCERTGDVIRQLNLCQIRIMEIDDGVTRQTVKMMMFFPIGVKPSGIALSFDNIDNFDFGKGEQGPVHCIQGNIGKIREKLFMDFVCTGMVFRLLERLVYGNPLRCHFEPLIPAQLGEPVHIDFRLIIHFYN